MVAGVAEGIRLLNDRYSPGSTSKEAARYQRCTGENLPLTILLRKPFCPCSPSCVGTLVGARTFRTSSPPHAHVL